MLKVNTVWYHYETNKKYRASGVWPDKPFYEFIEENSKKFPDKEAFIDSRWRLTYSRFVQMAKRLAFFFYESGLRPGDVVAIQAPNSAEIPLTEIACDYLDISFMALSDGWREKELRHLLKLSEAKAILIPNIYRGHDFVKSIELLRSELPFLKQVIVTGEDVPTGMTGSDKIFQKPVEMKYPDDFFEQFKPLGDAPRHLLCSSGTTALPKISCWSENNTYAIFVHHGCRLSMNLQEKDIVAAIAPANTASTGYGFPMLGPLCIGATVVTLHKWDPVDALKIIEKEKCSVAVMIPTQAIKILAEELDFYNFDNFTRLFNAGAKFPVEKMKEFEYRLKCKVLSAYGSTDAGAPAMININDPDEKRWETVGRTYNSEIKIVTDDRGTIAENGREGEIWWRGPDNMYGYVNSVEDDSACFTRDGFYKSGDVGFIDKDGYLHITGRIKEMIIRGGQNISPVEIEDLLYQHPDIIEVAVAAMPDPVFGEKACVFTVLRPGSNFSFDDMLSFLEDKKIAKWKLPERFEIIDEMPKSAGGKIMKRKLTEMVTDRLKQEGILPYDFKQQIRF